MNLNQFRFRLSVAWHLFIFLTNARFLEIDIFGSDRSRGDLELTSFTGVKANI